MDKIEIAPSELSGSVNIPPSKSMAHRAIICASLSKGISIISNINYSEDIISTISAMREMGADIKQDGSTLTINGDNTFSKTNYEIDANESGSTLRFLIPLTLVTENKVRFVGKGNLGKRPLNTYFNIFEMQNIEYVGKDNILDLTINGRLKSGTFNVYGDVSSQFISGLLFALPLLDGDSKINITTELESKSYVDLTIDMLGKFGITIKNNDYKEFLISGNSEYKCNDYVVEGDYSQGAFFLSANEIGSSINILGLDYNSLQGDKICIDILNEFKSDSEIVIDGSEFPDIIPILTVVAALRHGKTEIINIGRLKIKECDRLNAIAQELNKIGANVVANVDSLLINGVDMFTGGEVSSHNDHRIAMSLAIASTKCKNNLVISEPDCVKKSYPDFWQDFKSIGGTIV